ncbi:MAG TPA: hypothetical protein VGP47_09565 [Parachlamydiaceae bacterium]|nr:hypothetical protein [Nitrosopumilus sp.]HEV8052732.1 hypothetical protein [Parachlamydiaceae bacterium]
MNNQYIPAYYVIMAKEISAKVQKTLSDRYKMKILGVKSGLADCVNVLGLSFQIQGPLSKEELRVVLVGSVEEFLTQINSNLELRPFLKNYPFTTNEITITIFIKDKNGQSLYHPDISLAYSSTGEISFNTVDKNNIYGYESRERETYSTALVIVKDTNK